MYSIPEIIGRNSKVALISYETGQALTLAERDDKIETMRRELDNLGLIYKRVRGCYKGEVEDTFMVLMNDHVSEGDMVAIGRAFGQESVLSLEAHMGPRGREATLHYCDGEQPAEYLGMFRAVSREWALNECDGYTYDPATRVYYAIME